MARLKTVGFEQNTLENDSEIFSHSGNPKIVTNVGDDGSATFWDDLTGTWNSLTVPWGPDPGDALYDPNGVRSGFFGLRVDVGDIFVIKSSSQGGGSYNRIYIKLRELPDAPTSLCYFISDSDDINYVTIELQPDGTLRTHYRNNSNVRAYIGETSDPLEMGRFYAIELGIIGNEIGNTRTIECRIDHLRYMQATVTDLAAFPGYFGSGPNYDADDAATTGSWYCDDMATNDGNLLRNDDQNTWAGPGKVIILPVTNDDGSVTQVGWTRGGVDTGDDWNQVNDYAPPNDATDYLVGGDAAVAIDFRLANPFDYGIQSEDTIKVVAANARWRMEDTSDAGALFVYLRAGSNLSRDGVTINPEGITWKSGKSGGIAQDVFSTTFLPLSTFRWDIDNLASARIGMEVEEHIPDIWVTSMWLIVEYQPWENQTEFEINIDGVDRTNDVRFQTLRIDDIINQQANTSKFQMYDLHSVGAPESGHEVIITLNQVRIFAGLATKIDHAQLDNTNDLYSVKCTDYTRILDRRLVAATYTEMTDKAIIEAIISEYAPDDGITTYHVSEGVTINQISFNYVPVSKALEQIAELTGRNWFIDYNKDIHYFPLQQNQAPFEITSSGNQFRGLVLSKDDNQLRNRVFVRGGTELTTEPITETIVADGEQRQFLLAEKPHDIEVTLNSVPQTVGIKNIDEPDEFDFLLSFQEKYIEAGELTATPTAGDVVAISYNYDIPVLVAVEDTESIQEEQAKSGGSGVYEHVILDKQIATTQQARDRASAELNDYAATMVEANYQTMEKGLRSGQYQRFTMANKNVDQDYIINKVTFQSLGGGLFTHDVQLASAKTLGIIRFLIKMIGVDRRVGEFDPNEKVDQFFSLSDQLDSMTDSLTTDSQGYGFPWAADTTLPTGRHLRWDLGQWS